jgi:hypothetical protein
MAATEVLSREMLETYRITDANLFTVGAFERGITVFSQQVRALNLAWALVESRTLECESANGKAPKTTKKKIAVVGGGFAGLTVAAGLIKKRVHADIMIFEQRDTLLPLQQGSDSRWLHPRIYDWPTQGSEANVAMLPVLNWTAARASDVVVQILSEWANTVDEGSEPPGLYCNARHVQIHRVCGSKGNLQIEWIGEPRNARDGTTSSEQANARGKSESFDLVILAIGFGVERDNALSYWRNETLGQPSLGQPRSTYLISGQGDGAMIDLLRLRISQYRQDRILDELFRGQDRMLTAIQALHSRYLVPQSGDPSLFEALEALGADDLSCKVEFNKILQKLTQRLRRDTDAILHLKVQKFSDLFDVGDTKTSFQNKLLVYLLYKCGGFFPSRLKETELIKQNSISPDRVIRRHGTLRKEQLEEILDPELYDAIDASKVGFQCSNNLAWPGGYFGFPGRTKASSSARDSLRAVWRKEYLPGATALLSTTLCAAMAGVLIGQRSKSTALRVTLHRAVRFGQEELLQQTCEYFGASEPLKEKTAGRTFPANLATIGLAYKCRRIIRSRENIDPLALKAAAELLGLRTASRKMKKEVSFVLAIPILEPEEDGNFTAPRPVAGVVYIDSTDRDFYIDDLELQVLVEMIGQFVRGLEVSRQSFDRIRNVMLSGLGSKAPAADALPDFVAHAFEFADLAPARTSGPFQLNFDQSDFIPLHGQS